MTDFTERIEKLLRERLAIPPEMLPEYRCAACRDFGWMETRDELDRRVWKECACQKVRRSERMIRQSGLMELIQRDTFDSFRTENPLQQRMLDTAMAYLQVLTEAPGRRDKPWMYIGGNPGSGKTHICTAVCGELLRRGVSVAYMKWDREARKLKAEINEPDFENLTEKYVECDVLYVDDLLKTRYAEIPVFTDADIRLAFMILNERYVRNKPTVISCEWDLIGQLLPADEGVFSRVYERCKGYTVSIPRDVKYNYRLNAV